MTKDQALQLALDALEYEAKIGNDAAYKKEREAIKEALAEPQQEPVYFIWNRDDHPSRWDTVDKDEFDSVKNAEDKWLLYEAPPQRPWQGLTDEEIAEVGKGSVEGKRMLPYAFARAIEAELKEKNHG